MQRKLALIVLATILTATIQAQTVPPGLPQTVSIDSLGQKFGGHSFTMNVDPQSPKFGQFTFHTKGQGDFTGVMSITYIGSTPPFNAPDWTALHVNKDAKSIIRFSFGTAVKGKLPQGFEVSGILDICTQTGQVTLGLPTSSYNISNEVVHDQCTAPPTPARRFTCIADGSNVLRYDDLGVFTLQLDGVFRTSGSLRSFDVDGITVLRSPGDDTDITVVLNNGVATVIVLSHGQLRAVLVGSAKECQ